MKFLPSPSAAKLTATAFLVFAGSAQAHTGHDTSSVFSGLVHPLGLDHMLAMLAVGLWSVTALPAQRSWQGPALFLLLLSAGATLGLLGLQVARLEQLIALSVVLFGALLMLSLRSLPASLGLGLVALAALAHGLAHGAEAPANGLAPYALGFLASTAALHLGGVATGLALRAALADKARRVLVGLGSALGLGGLYLMAQVG